MFLLPLNKKAKVKNGLTGFKNYFLFWANNKKDFMADKISKEKRSWTMSRIRSKNTKPEIRVRSFLHRSGYRFRIHRKDLPGKPDIVLPKYKTVVFVHGCFWHHHRGCRNGKFPKSNLDYWKPKIEKNVERDKEHQIKLKKQGWKIIVLWECQIKSDEDLVPLLLDKLSLG